MVVKQLPDRTSFAPILLEYLRLFKRAVGEGGEGQVLAKVLRRRLGQ